jgi:hypothetical protein
VANRRRREPESDALTLRARSDGTVEVRRPDGPPSVWTVERLAELAERATAWLWDQPVPFAPRED